ncbi:MAG: sodium/solute symporter [Clostridia bacterium]|nr:sodium/solute symporter [Clostridia bacterium]
MFKFVMLGTFVAILLASGFLAMKKTKTIGDFFLGGRNIGPWLSAFAFGTTYFSAVIFVGYAGKIGWSFGIAGLWVGIGNALVGSLLAWKLLAKPTREMTEKLGAMTMPEFLQARYDSHSLKIYAALVIFVFMVPYSASVFMGLSYVFEQVFQINYNFVLVAITVITAIYLLMGGYRAVAITDFIQGMVMIFGVCILIYYVFGHPAVGGFAQVLPKLAQIDSGLASFFPTGHNGVALFSVVLLTSLGTWGLPQMAQKFYAIKDKEKIKAATVISTLFCIIIGLGAYGVGAVSHLYFAELPMDPATGKATVDLLVPQILEIALPEFAAVIILLLVLAASMSTLSSLVLISSSSITIDLVKGYLRPQMQKKNELLLMRSFCLLFIMLSAVLALLKPAIILTLMALSWGTVAGVFLGPYLWGLFWKGTTKMGAWSGALVGLIFSLGFSWFHHFDAGYVPIGGALAMLLSLAVVPAVSLVTERFSQEHLLKVFVEQPETR